MFFYIITIFYSKVNKYIKIFTKQRKQTLNEERELLTTGRLNINLCNFVLCLLTP